MLSATVPAGKNSKKRWRDVSPVTMMRARSEIDDHDPGRYPASLCRYHHDPRPRLQELPRLAIRDPAAPDDDATLAVEVEENGIEYSTFVLDLRLQINVPGWRGSLA